MNTDLKLRKIAPQEWSAGHVLSVHGLQIGVRFRLPYLKKPLQDWLDDEPDGELARKLHLIGLESRNPQRGHGYIQLTSTDCSCRARSRVGNGIQRIRQCFSAELSQEILKLLSREYQMHISELMRELEDTLKSLRSVGETHQAVHSYARTEASLGLDVREMPGAAFFGYWVNTVLNSSQPEPQTTPISI